MENTVKNFSAMFLLKCTVNSRLSKHSERTGNHEKTFRLQSEHAMKRTHCQSIVLSKIDENRCKQTVASLP